MDEERPNAFADALEQRTATPPSVNNETAAPTAADALARGSGHIGKVVAPERGNTNSEDSVMALLPEAKAERVAAMRRELADLQRQLIDAQQRIATELQGRAEDAERFEALEAKTQQSATRIKELETEITGLRSQLTTIETTADDVRRDVKTRDAELEAARTQHAEINERLKATTTSLDETKATLTTREAEVATLTSERDTNREAIAALTKERDALKTELEQVRGEIETTRNKTRDVATYLARVSQQLIDGGNVDAPIHTPRTNIEPSTHAAANGNAGDNDITATSNANANANVTTTDVAKTDADVAKTDANIATATATTATTATESKPPRVRTTTDRPQPPPLPRRSGATNTVRAEMETIVAVVEEPKAGSRIRTALVLFGGVALGCAATLAYAKSSSNPTNAAATVEQAAETQPTVETPTLTENNGAAAATVQPVINANHNEQPTAAPSFEAPVAAPVAPAVNTEPTLDNAVTTPTNATDGVLLLPPAAGNHRVFVDGTVVPVKDLKATVPCGTRAIQIGSRGTAQTVEVACGGETVVRKPLTND